MITSCNRLREEKSRGCTQRALRPLQVWEHTCETIRALNEVARFSSPEVRGIFDSTACSQSVWQRVRKTHEDNPPRLVETNAKEALAVLLGSSASPCTGGGSDSTEPH